MSTLETAVGRLPAFFQKRYGDSYWINWANLLLEDLAGRGVMKELKFETGVRIYDDVWINKPTGLRSIVEVYNPNDRNQKFRVEDIQGRLRLLDFELTSDPTAESITAFTDFLTTGFDVDITGKEEDDWKNYLFSVTGGTLTGKNYVLGGNDASGVTETTVQLLHPLSAAFTALQVTAGEIISYDYYLMLKYLGFYTEISAIGDELPIDNAFERRVVNAYLRWKAEEEANSLSEQTVYWGTQAQNELNKLEAEMAPRPISRAKGRRLIGFEDPSKFSSKNYPEMSEYGYQ